MKKTEKLLFGYHLKEHIYSMIYVQCWEACLNFVAIVLKLLSSEKATPTH